MRAMDFVYLVASFAVILAGALLFTNAVEWIGHRLELGEGAVGSLLAAVGTAMPETLIAIVALIGASESAEDVAIGAIVGAPFLLATLAMGLVGLFAYLYRDRREQGIELRAHVPTLDRDLIFFLVFFALALALGFGASEGIRIVAGILFFAAYPVYVWRTLRGGGEAQPEETLNPLIIERRPGRERPEHRDRGPPVPGRARGHGRRRPPLRGGAALVAEDVGVEAIVLSLILAPLATELPEKVNSFFWVRDGKDSLALGNITGAMVFQSMIPVGIGLIFTDWDLSGNAAVSVALGLAGGVIAYWALRLRDRFELPAVLAWISLYAAFIVVVAV